MSISVVVADDAPLVREGVCSLLTAQGFRVLGQTDSGPGAISLARQQRPDVVVLDIRMPPGYAGEGVRAAHTIRQEHPSMGIVLLSQFITLEGLDTLLAPQRDPQSFGYLLKERVGSASELASCVRRVHGGEVVLDPEVVSSLAEGFSASGMDRLSTRELEILTLMAQGLSNAGIAERLFLSLRTVESHVAGVFRRLGLDHDACSNRRVCAVLRYLQPELSQGVAHASDR